MHKKRFFILYSYEKNTLVAPPCRVNPQVMGVPKFEENSTYEPLCKRRENTIWPMNDFLYKIKTTKTTMQTIIALILE